MRATARQVQAAVSVLTKARTEGKMKVGARDTLLRSRFEGKPCIYCMYDGKPYAVALLAPTEDGVYMRFSRLYLCPRTRRDTVMLSRLRAVAGLAGCRVAFDCADTWTFCTCSSVAPLKCNAACRAFRRIPYAAGVMYDLEKREIGAVVMIRRAEDEQD